MKALIEHLIIVTKNKFIKHQRESVMLKILSKILPPGRPLLLCSLDQIVQRYLLATRSKGGLISSEIATATAKALIARYPEYNLGHLDLDSSSWAKSLFKIMVYVKQMSITGKVEIP